jgi:hypothetical protein
MLVSLYAVNLVVHLNINPDWNEDWSKNGAASGCRKTDLHHAMTESMVKSLRVFLFAGAFVAHVLRQDIHPIPSYGPKRADLVVKGWSQLSIAGVILVLYLV